MKGVHDWLADDVRTERVFWLLIALNVAGGIVSVASSRQQPLINDAVVVLNFGLVGVVTVIRGLAVEARWLAALGVSLEVATVALHWHPVGVIGLLASFLGFAVLIVLVFYRHAPGAQDNDIGATMDVSTTVPSDEAAGSPGSAPGRRSLPGDPDFTYPPPPR